ncbi:MAG: hypothetical protein IJ717_08925 [Treponema sp.]|nr:hypothetical protein [Treponema sp.]
MKYKNVNSWNFNVVQKVHTVEDNDYNSNFVLDEQRLNLAIQRRNALRSKYGESAFRLANVLRENRWNFCVYKDSLSGLMFSNKFSDRNVWPAKLEVGKQQKHIKGHRNFIPGKSILTVPLEKAAELLDRYSGNGVVVGNPETSNKEWVNFRTVIGESFNGGRSEGMTPKGMIHHSKKGCHIVPSSPKGDYK